MVEVFATNVSCEAESKKLLAVLAKHYPECEITIDLKDCDRVLRIQNDHGRLCPADIIQLVKIASYEIKTL